MESKETQLFEANDQTREAIKGKRTRRQRPSSPYGSRPLAVTSSSSSGVDYSTEEVEDFAYISPQRITEEISEEEEDMANCLILLAQGNCSSVVKSRSNASVTTYECKTCNRSFPSFQSLGGHRASHKRPKQNTTAVGDDFGVSQLDKKYSSTAVSPPVQMGNKGKIHECSICRLEFSSGQALGGHMRRHRATVASPTTSSASLKPGRNVLQLDLNLPAPEDDRPDGKFQFMTTKQPLVFSAPALVDCHY